MTKTIPIVKIKRIFLLDGKYIYKVRNFSEISYVTEQTFDSVKEAETWAIKNGYYIME